MFDILKELTNTDNNSKSSRVNAQIYLDKVSESIAIIKDLYNKDKSEAKAIRLTSTDTIASTRPFDINGKKVSFKMAFNHGSATPYAVEITTLVIIDE